MIHYRKLPTEQKNPASKALDSLTVEQAVQLMYREDRKIPDDVHREKIKIVAAIKMIVRSLKTGGRIFFVGAGTSGRLGVLESAELPPTFSTPPQLAQAVMAGGKKAVFRSQEGAEDDAQAAKNEIHRRVRKNDTVIGIAASGVTPFVRSALNQSKKMGAATIFVTCNSRSPIRIADIVIAPRVGPEIIAGSTRLKSATATKMILNMLTTLSMVRMGKVYGNRMADLQPKSKKLRERGIGLIQELAGLSRSKAENFFQSAQGSVKTAIVMAKKNLNFVEASKLLKHHQGFLGPILKSR